MTAQSLTMRGRGGKDAAGRKKSLTPKSKF